jgi:phosphotransferase system enzyme I (PtsI)
MDVRLVISERRILRDDRSGELARFEGALGVADDQLVELERKIEDRHGEGHDLIEVHRLMLQSRELIEPVRRSITDQCLAAEWAVFQALARIRTIFSGLGDPLFRERGSDFEAVGERLLRVLLGLPELHPGARTSKGTIAVATEISPLDLFSLKRAEVGGLISESGGRTSHAAIVAQALEMPYVLGVRNLAGKVRPGALVIMDGGQGDVFVDPDARTEQAYRARRAAQRARVERLAVARTTPAVTTDGVAIGLAANVEALAGMETAVASGATAIGLFRTEFLYLERPDLPTEEEQYRDAVAVLQAAGGLPVTFRTLDVGGDKLPLSITIPGGPNPALGVRSIRLTLQRPELFLTQLRALYRAAVVGPLRLMFPLISGVTELRHARAACEEARASLARERIAHDPTVPIGLMIETPSAVATVDHLARHCDFFSLGTNDLIQYGFAADRENDDVANLYQPLHPAVLRWLKSAIDAARAAARPITICGDMAGDPMLTWMLIGLGLRELSMEPRHIPLVKAVVRRSSLAEAEELAAKALALEDEVAVGLLVERAIGDRFSDLLDDEIQELPPEEGAGTGAVPDATAPVSGPARYGG